MNIYIPPLSTSVHCGVSIALIWRTQALCSSVSHVVWLHDHVEFTKACDSVCVCVCLCVCVCVHVCVSVCVWMNAIDHSFLPYCGDRIT